MPEDAPFRFVIRVGANGMLAIVLKTIPRFIRSEIMQSQRAQPTEFAFPSRLHAGRKALDLATVSKRKIRPAFEKVGITGVGWHTFRHTAGTVLAELGEHQLRIRAYLRPANLSVTNEYLQAASKTKRNAQARLVEAILPVHLLPGRTAEAVAP
jgi:integrase